MSFQKLVVPLQCNREIATLYFIRPILTTSAKTIMAQSLVNVTLIFDNGAVLSLNETDFACYKNHNDFSSEIETKQNCKIREIIFDMPELEEVLISEWVFSEGKFDDNFFVLCRGLLEGRDEVEELSEDILTFYLKAFGSKDKYHTTTYSSLVNSFIGYYDTIEDFIEDVFFVRLNNGNSKSILKEVFLGTEYKEANNMYYRTHTA